MAIITNFNKLADVASEFRKYLTGDHRKQKDVILFYAHNGTGKTRLSMEFKKMGKETVQNNLVDEEDNIITDEEGSAFTTEELKRDTLYFNAFTEDLFSWDNDLDSDEHRVLLLNKHSKFFGGIENLDIDNKIRPILHNYSDFNFVTDFNYVKPTDAGQENPETYWAIRFIREELVDGVAQNVENIKISRGEENLFIWCFFLAIYELAIDGAEGYDWVKYVYIDDPISSLDENNAIALACGLATIMESGIYKEIEEAGEKKKVERDRKVKVVLSTHHSLFFNVMYNELKMKRKTYFLHSNGLLDYKLQDTEDTPFFHHIALLSELKRVAESDVIHTYHFNGLRTVMEKAVSFFGYRKIDEVIHGLEDDILFHRAVQLLSHGKYSIFAPSPMTPDTKDLFKKILKGFTDKYQFRFPEIFNEVIPTEEV
ncbi:anticodon nuclease [Echinicola strongylocentroti]|uniref:Anticodon nuclease n=1 Tax=Echinicola strongylocentroti TaxID=1795355 RepID=A0A2Z4IG21_9BACT|nr:AAA family ATPase [Echinicola strongylocentroti]AWW29438.1 anticodon nuclease [Echinicola strongylocentroti]